ncbi:MAG: sigma-70 family RNA polymerase sigma factor [Lachnospiraceae bacterium]|nr:sigma-70 family RNA polymerase sigma factor [Lachnospiraceae bacterium]
MNKEEFAGVVLAATDSLYRVSHAVLRSDTDCEDAVQEAIAIAFEKLYTLKQDEYAKTWLTRILIHECYHIQKRRKQTVCLQEDNPEFSYHQNDYLDLYQAVMGLSEQHRLVVILHHLEGYSVEEVAKMLRVPQGTVKSRLSRAREQLKKDLEEEAYEFCRL